MKRFISALVLCFSLLILLSVFLFPPVEAKDDVFLALLNLPAPPAPNPLVRRAWRERDQKFYSKSSPPRDDAPIEDLLDYWRQQSGEVQALRFTPEMSERVRERLIKEIGKDPKLLTGFLNVLKGDPKGVDFVKELYDREGTGGSFDKDERQTIRHWLTYNSPYFSNDLARLASGVSDTGEYVTQHEELLALGRVDFDKARPLIDRLYSDSSLKTSRVLANWALYRHALDTGSPGDIERYRDELKKTVEDKSAIPGMRDLALDALASEKEWPGRDEWYFSLFGDETLADIKVGGQTYTGLTTLILVSPEEKYIAKMLELAKSDNAAVRGAAVRNLVTRLETGGPEVLRALLPWLEDPKWAGDAENSRQTLIQKLSEYEMPESVPGLIKVVDERQTQITSLSAANAANMAANSLMRIGNAAVTVANRVTAANRPAANVSAGKDLVETVIYPHRYLAVMALKKQKDARAIPALRRILPDSESYDLLNVVGAILACGGFTVGEQLDALETAAKGVRDEMDAAERTGSDANAAVANWGDPHSQFANANAASARRSVGTAEIRAMLGEHLMQAAEISDELARAVVDRIEALDAKDAKLAGAYRKMILKWQNAAINILLLRDVKRGAADADTIVRLLSQRRELREKQPSDVFDLRTGKPSAIGIAACLLEDAPDYAAILDTGDAETKTALLACSRLIRAPLSVAEVAKNLTSSNVTLTLAAERYLESEDSPAARSIVLARYPNEAKILGATSAFFPDGAGNSGSEHLWELYRSLGNDSLYYGWSGSGNDGDLEAAGKRLQAEVKKDGDLAGLYSYDGNYIRIYKDRVIFSWDEDASRYRERALSKDEFDEIKSYLTENRADELPPFLSCGGEYCEAKELLMLSRNGGRRVYMNGDAADFFAGLDKYFATLKQSPATLKYALSREIPGLEIVLASDELHAETVWKEGADLRVAASETAVRKKVTTEIEDTDIDAEGGVPIIGQDEAVKKAALIEKRRYEGYSWYAIRDGMVTGTAAQPTQVEIIPIRDHLAVQPSREQWKARGSGFEIRTSPDGIFMAVRGKLAKLREGNYGKAVIAPGGRWAVAYKSGEDGAEGVVRVDLVTKKEYPIELEGYGQRYPVAFVPTLNKILIVRNDRYDFGAGYQLNEEDDRSPNDDDPDGMILVDPATGATQPIAGEFRPLSQQTFRALQKASKPNEFWAAMFDPEKNETQVGIYETKTFGFAPVLRIPKISFNSMKMWVDEPAGKVYFVYRGHLLALPLGK